MTYTMTMNQWKEKANNKLGGSPWKSQGHPQTITDYQCHVRGLFSNQPLQPSRGTQPHFKKIFHIQGWHFSWHWKFVTETALVWSIDCSRGIKCIWGASFLFAALSRAKLQHVQCQVWRLFCIASRSGLVNFLSTFPAWLTLLLFSACGMTGCCQSIWKMCYRQSRRGVPRQNMEKCKTIVVSQTLLHTNACGKELWLNLFLLDPSGSSRIFLPYPNFDTDCSQEELC